MALLPLLYAPDPRLKRKAQPVVQVDARIRQLLDDMLETMYANRGIGLAAPQVDIPEQVIVMDLAEKEEPPEPRFFINPKILWHSEERLPFNEGCLSLPDQYADVERPAQIRVRFLNRDGNSEEITADGLLAVCLQHEMDHLNGVLFVDHISALKRNIILRKLQKLRKLKE